MKRNLLLSALFVLGTILLNTTTQAQSFTMGFEANEPLTGWAFVNNSDSPNADWGITDNPNGTFFNAFAGTRYAAATFNSTSQSSATGATISNWLFAPVRFLRNGDVISFYTRRTSSQYEDRLELRLSTNGNSINIGTTPTDVGDFSELLVAVNPNLTAGGYPQTWTQYTVTLSGLPANGVSGRFAFRYFVTDGGPAGNNSDFIGLDNVAYTSSYTPPAGACVQTVGVVASFGAAPCDNGGGCPFNEIDDFEVWASESYLLENVVAGNTYTFSMCNGLGANTWVPEFTIIDPNGTVETFGAGAPVACEFTWTAAASGNYEIVINQAGSCGVANQIDNGFPAITCSGSAVCPPSDCEAGNIVSALSDTLCPGESYNLLLANDTVPSGGTYMLAFVPDDASVNAINLNGAGPFTINADLNGLLPANNFPNFEGQYTVYVLVARNAADIQNTLCSISEDSLRIYFSTGPDSSATITAGSNTTFCDGGNVTLSSNVSSNITWSNGATSNSISATTAGNYFVVVSDNVGCTDTSNTISVTVNPLPTVTVNPSGPITLCDGQSEVLTTNNTSGNVWSVSGQTGNTLTVNSAGSYTVTHTDGNNCSATSNAVVVTTNPTVSANFSYSGATFCSTGSNPIPTVDNPGGTFSVSTSGLTFVSTSTGEIDLANSSNGTYAIQYVSASACPDSSVVTVSINSSPDASFTYANTSYCKNGNNPTPTFPTGASAGLFSASPAGLQFVNTNTGVINLGASTPGTYVVTNTIAASGSCPAASETFSVTIEDIVTPTISSSGPVTFCDGDSVVLTSSVNNNILWSNGSTDASITVTQSDVFSVTATSGSGNCTATSANLTVTVNPIPNAPSLSQPAVVEVCGPQNLTIATSDGSGVTWQPSNVFGSSITVNSSGVYSAVVTSTAGCTNSTSVEYVINPLPTAPIITANGPTTFCQGEDVELSSDVTDGIAWSTGATSGTITINNGVAGLTVTVTDTNNCSATSAPIDVVVNPLPPAPTITPAGPIVLCPDAEEDLIANVTTGIVWSNNETTPNIVVDSEGSYTVTFTDANGCSSTSAPVEVTEDDCVGVNDILFVDNLEVYPNPTNNILNINFENSQSENIVIRIISFSGKEVYSEVIGKDIFRFNKTYNFEDKAAGVYILQLTSNKGVINKKVVLQK